MSQSLGLGKKRGFRAWGGKLESGIRGACDAMLAVRNIGRNEAPKAGSWVV